MQRCMWARAGARIYRGSVHGWADVCAARGGSRAFRMPSALAGAVAIGAWSVCYASTSRPALADSPRDAAYGGNGQPSESLVSEARAWVERRRKTGDSHGAEDWVQLVQAAAAAPLAGRRVLIFVNPECGAKTAKAHCDDIVRPMLTALGCVSTEVQETDDKKAAMELLETADLSGIDAVRRSASVLDTGLSSCVRAPDRLLCSVAAAH